MMKKMATAECPECLAELDIPEDVMIGEIFSCPDCGLELEVESVSTEKIGLQKLAIEKEDWGE
jgi:alpha-aminoadipate carrier protein LysW